MSHGRQLTEVPNSTQTPNVFFTHLLAELSSAEVRAYAYICYHTFGYGKDVDAISYDQFLRGQVTSDGRVLDRGCGIKNRNTLAAALHGLEEKGLIVACHEHDEQGHRRATTFALVLTGQDTPLAQAAGNPEYQNRYSGQNIGNDTLAAKTDTLAAQSITTDTQAKVSKMIHTVPGSSNYGVGNTGVPRSDSKNPGDASARKDGSTYTTRARAREVPSLSKSEVDPLEQERGRADWALDMALRLYEHWGGDPAEGVPADWCECLRQNLGDCTEAERNDFLSYVLSNGILRGISSPRGVCTVLSQDAKHWKLRGKPSRKSSVGTSAPKVPAHVQWEHDHAHKPKQNSPERIARIVADLRKYKGDAFAERWLQENGLTETGT